MSSLIESKSPLSDLLRPVIGMKKKKEISKFKIDVCIRKQTRGSRWLLLVLPLSAQCNRLEYLHRELSTRKVKWEFGPLNVCHLLKLST